MSNLQQLKQIIERTNGDVLVERGLMLTLVDNINAQVQNALDELDMCCGTGANKSKLIKIFNDLKYDKR